MSRHFTATILLNRLWPMDIDRLAEAVRQRFPQIGEVSQFPGQAGGHDAGILTIEGAQVVVEEEGNRLAEDLLEPSMKILRPWDPEEVKRTHRASITISCGGRLKGLEGAEAYAAATHFVAAAVADVVPSSAVLWRQSWSLMTAEQFNQGADDLLAGNMPLGIWLGYAPIVPRGFEPNEATGIVTYGLRNFIGRELELAPRPGDARSAYQSLSAIARLVMDRGLTLQDGQRLKDEDHGVTFTVRERTFWLRRDHSAFVLVADDSVVDPGSLRPREAPEEYASGQSQHVQR